MQKEDSRREFLRSSVEFKAEVTFQKEEIKGKLISCSLGGGLFETQNMLNAKVKDKALITVYLGHNQFITGKVEFVFVEKNQFGFKYLDIDTVSIELLMNVMRYRTAMTEKIQKERDKLKEKNIL